MIPDTPIWTHECTEFLANEWRAYTPNEIATMRPRRYVHVWNHLMAECTRLGISTVSAEADWDETEQGSFEDYQRAVVIARAKESIDTAAKKFIDQSV